MPIMQLGDPSKLEVMLEMLSEDAVEVHEGATATLERWGGKPLKARVRRVEPFGYTKISALGIEEQRVRVLLDFIDPPESWQSLGHGYRVNAKIVVWEGHNILKLPVGALFRQGSEWVTYVINGHFVELRHVSVGHFNDTEVEVLNGVSEGDLVVLNPSDRISAGVPVQGRNS
jgi:HlyD family secretion protein